MIRGLAAALLVLLLFTVGTAVAARGVAAPAGDAYSCSAVDRKFIESARVNLTAFAGWREDYARGGVDHDEFAAFAEEARALVERAAPHDRALAQARLLAGAMFSEWARAAAERGAGGLGAGPMIHAQQLDVALRGHLSDAAPGLAAAGCEISSLFAV